MKNIAHKNLKAVVLCLSLLALSSCKKYLDVPLPTDRISTETAFNNASVIEGMMQNLYLKSTFEGSSAIEPYTIRYEAWADNGYNPTGSQTEFQMDYPSVETAMYNGHWSSGYKAIYLANLMLEGLATVKPTVLDEETKNTYIAASLTIRAINYFMLVREYGDVPLQLTSNPDDNKLKARTPKADVLAQVESDLKEAITLLPEEKGPDYYINSKYIPEAILANVYLWQKKWADAEVMATDIIGSGQYSLEDDLNAVFRQGSAETIFALTFTNSWYGNDKIADYSWMLWPGLSGDPSRETGVALSQSLLNSFEPGDMRKENWVIEVNYTEYPDPAYRQWCYKYKWNYFDDPDIPAGEEEDLKFIRYAEVLLIRAEALAEQGKVDAAAEDLNLIRNRAGLENTTAASKEAMIEAVRNERRHELFFENDFRWYDLIRWGTIDATLRTLPYKTGWDPKMVMWPLSVQELQYNPNLTQTPGW